MDAWSLMRGDAFIHFVSGSRRVNIRLGVLLLIPKSPQVKASSIPIQHKFFYSTQFNYLHNEMFSGIAVYCCIATIIISVTTVIQHINTIGRLKYTGDSVVQIRTFINFLTSEFGSSKRGERDTILNHSIQTKLKRLAHLVVFKISVGGDLPNSMDRLQLLNTMVLTQLQLSTWPKSTFNWTGPSRVPNSTGLQ